MKQLSLSQFARDPMPAHLLSNAMRTIELINAVLSEMPELRFTSGFRSAARNAKVGGVSNSKHVQALAADFVTRDGRYPASLVERFKAIAAPRGYNAYVHNAGSALHLHSEYRAGTPAKGVNASLNVSLNGQAENSNTLVYGVFALLLFAVLSR